MNTFVRLTVSGTLLAATLLVSTPVFAETASTATSTITGGITPAQLACVQTAVNTREAAISVSWGTYSSAVSSALSTRGSALNAAWGMTTGRGAAIKSAWKAYSTAASAARKSYRKTRDSAWTAFRTARRACGVNTTGGDAEQGIE